MNIIDSTVIIYHFETHIENNILLNILHAFNNQTYRHFNVIIYTSDINYNYVEKLITDTKLDFFYAIKCFTTEKKISKAPLNEYCIFTKAKTIPDRHFIENQVAIREFGFYLKGSLQKIRAPLFSITDIYQEKFITQKKETNEDYFFSAWTKEIDLETFDFNDISASIKSSKFKKVKTKSVYF